jgi:hypothetical protein
MARSTGEDGNLTPSPLSFALAKERGSKCGTGMFRERHGTPHESPLSFALAKAPYERGRG